MPLIKVLIAGSYVLLREALKSILAAEQDIEIIGIASSVDEAVETISKQEPDIVIVSLLKPNVATSSLIKKSRKINPHVKFVTIVDVNPTDTLQELLEMKVSSVLSINSEPEFLKLAIRKAFEGDTYIDPSISQKVNNGGSKPEEYKLSSRQLQILKMVAQGYTNKRISAELNISQDTVKTHVRIIFKKLKAVNRAQAVSKAYSLGILNG